MQALSNEQLRKIAPSVFAERPWQGVSSKYAFIPTISVVERLRKEGFVPVRAAQSSARIEGKGQYTRHVLRFRRESDLVNLPRVVDGNAHHFYKEPPTVLELVLQNAHDLTSAYSLDAGLWRQLCSNGLVVCSSHFESIHVRHSGNIVDDVLEGSYRIIEEAPQLMQQVERMQKQRLTYGEQLAFAKAAVALRWDPEHAPVQAQQLLQARREEDKEADLWTTFNKVQEHIVKGGLRGRATTGRKLRTRAIGSVGEDMRLNKALWVLAEELGKQAVRQQ